MNLKNKIATIAAASIIALSMGTSALAQSATTGQVTVQITPGTLSYSIAEGKLDQVLYNEVETSSTGTLQLSTNGNGNLEGWTLSVQATGDFVYDGISEHGEDIPAGHLFLTQPQAPTHTAGQAIDTTHGPVATGTAGSLETPTEVITSAAGYGSGSYSQDLDVSLTIPAYSQVGTYTGVVTVSASSAPGAE